MHCKTAKFPQSLPKLNLRGDISIRKYTFPLRFPEEYCGKI